MSASGERAAPLEFELSDAFLNRVNEFRLHLRASDGGTIILEFAPESDGFERVVEGLTQATTRALSGLGSRGIVITGLTEASDSDEEESA